MGNRSVLLVDDDEDLRQSVGELVGILCGYDCVACDGLNELVGARERALACQAAIIDINLGAGRPSGLVVYDWLRAERFAGRILFLTGHAATHPLVRDAASRVDADVLTKPIAADALRRALADSYSIPSAPSIA